MSKHSGISNFAEFDSDYAGGRSWLVGIDEAGRGSLAGEVCAAATAVSSGLYKNKKYLSLIENINDSKRLSPAARDGIFESLCALKMAGAIDFEAAFASVDEIERLNILGATQLAMARACSAVNERLSLNLRKAGASMTLFGEALLDTSKAVVLIDGNPLKKFPFAHKAVVHGDALSLAIAAASIVAKVSRDRRMVEIASKYPRYGFEIHKGYGTPLHLQNLLLFGACEIHRPSFLKKMRSQTSAKPQQTSFF